MTVPSIFSLPFLFFISFCYVVKDIQDHFLCGPSILRRNLALLCRVGYDYPCLFYVFYFMLEFFTVRFVIGSVCEFSDFHCGWCWLCMYAWSCCRWGAIMN